jgi:hypothetical protein
MVHRRAGGGARRCFVVQNKTHAAERNPHHIRSCDLGLVDFFAPEFLYVEVDRLLHIRAVEMNVIELEFHAESSLDFPLVVSYSIGGFYQRQTEQVNSIVIAAFPAEGSGSAGVFEKRRNVEDNEITDVSAKWLVKAVSAD